MTTQRERESISAPINREAPKRKNIQEIEQQLLEKNRLAPITKPKKSLWNQFLDIFKQP